MSVSPVPAKGARKHIGHRRAASRLLVDPDPALDVRRQAVLQTDQDGRNAVLVELSVTPEAGVST